jgi:hypothetical protein
MTNSERTREYDDAFWLDGEALIIREEPRAKPVYDLEERTARFGEAVKTRRMTKQIRMTDDESRCVFDIRISSFLRHSSFVLRHSAAFPVRHSSFF